MSVQEQITRLSGAKTDIANAITAKGVTVPSGTKIDGMADLIGNISTGVDTSDATAAAGDIRSGKTAYVDGEKVTGTIDTKTASNLSASGATVTVPAGYYASQVSKSVATATQATPSISVDSAGKITASATQSAGYVSAGTKSATKQLTTKAATTYTPGTSNQTIAKSTYLTGVQTIKGDSNLKSENIISGVSIFGVSGSATSGAEIVSGNITVTQTQKITIPIAATPKMFILSVKISGLFSSGQSGILWIIWTSNAQYVYYNNGTYVTMNTDDMTTSISNGAFQITLNYTNVIYGMTYNWYAIT